jgi:hypothetical protein
MTKRALLIGCNYTATPSVQLAGCISDIVNARNTLIDAYGYQDVNIYMLRDDDASRLPTKAKIIYYLTQVLSSSSANDTVWIHYSGHGTQIKSLDSDEIDKLDECIVPCDYATAGIITDNELYALLKNAKPRILLLFDSCHSGTGCDLQYSINYNNGTLSKVVNNKKFIPSPNIVMISGCQDAQTSADAYDNMSKRAVGAFTQTLLETLRTSDHNIAILPLYAKLCANLKSFGFTQMPVLSSTVPIPIFQFSRANANGSPILTTNASTVTTSAATTTTATNPTKKDIVLTGNVVAASPVTRTLRGLMTSLLGQ